MYAAALSVLLAGAGILALGGCATTKGIAGKGKQALVCPQCKMVAVTVSRPYLGDFGYSGYGYGGYGYGGTDTVYTEGRIRCIKTPVPTVRA